MGPLPNALPEARADPVHNGSLKNPSTVMSHLMSKRIEMADLRTVGRWAAGAATGSGARSPSAFDLADACAACQQELAAGAAKTASG